MIRLALTLLALTTTACIPPATEPVPAPLPEPTGACNAQAVQGYVGSFAGEATVKKIVAESGSRNARVIKPGMAVTMDYREDRVNVRVDDDNRILSINCG